MVKELWFAVMDAAAVMAVFFLVMYLVRCVYVLLTIQTYYWCRRLLSSLGQLRQVKAC